MTKVQTEKYRDQLRALATRVGATVAGLVDNVRTPTGGQAGGGLSNTPMHLGDVGTDVFNQELDATILENEAFIRDETLAALRRLDRGMYGKCEMCAHAIARERLEALPYTRYCSRCASRAQSGRAVNVNDGRLISSESQMNDIHASGTPGGGTAIGGLAGTNLGAGEPSRAKLEQAMGSANFDVALDNGEGEDMPEAFSGPTGGAVGGTPANKRARGGKTTRALAGGITPRNEPKKPRRR
jgi:DnaK suppressor protein